MGRLIVIAVLAACGDNLELEPDAQIAAPVRDAGIDAAPDAPICQPRHSASTCGEAPVGPEWREWDGTYSGDGTVTLTVEEYEEVLAYEDKTLMWMRCRLYYDRLNGEL